MAINPFHAASHLVIICSELTIETLEQGGCEICAKLTICHWRRSGVSIVNFEHISHLVLVFLLLTVSR